MYAKSTRPSAKREVQKERSTKRDDRIARRRRAKTCARSAQWECAREAGRFFSFNSCGIQKSSFLTSPRRCIWRSIDDFGIFNISSIYCIVTRWSDSIMALLIFEWKIPRTEFIKPISTLSVFWGFLTIHIT